MDGRQKPDPQTESGTDLNDKEVIELTEIVEEGDGYNVIDLNDIIEPPDQAMEAVVEPEEEAIPLVNALPKEETTDSPEETDDAIIDLMDVATTPEGDTAGTGMPEPDTMPDETAGATEDEDDVIDLMDVAATLENDTAGTGMPAPDTTPEETAGATEDEDDVIDLMDVAATLENDTAGTGMPAPDTTPEETDETVPEDEPVIDLLDAVEPQTAEAGITVETDDEFSDLESRADAVLTDAGNAFDVETPEEAAETAGPDSDFMIFEDNQAIIGDVNDQPENTPDVSESVAAPLVVPASPSEPVPLTEAQIEAALERTIEKIYGEKIEQLMIRTIEKTVTREIARIKNALLEDEDDKIG